MTGESASRAVASRLRLSALTGVTLAAQAAYRFPGNVGGPLGPCRWGALMVGVRFIRVEDLDKMVPGYNPDGTTWREYFDSERQNSALREEEPLDGDETFDDVRHTWYR